MSIHLVDIGHTSLAGLFDTPKSTRGEEGEIHPIRNENETEDSYRDRTAVDRRHGKTHRARDPPDWKIVKGGRMDG